QEGAALARAEGPPGTRHAVPAQPAEVDALLVIDSHMAGGANGPHARRTVRRSCGHDASPRCKRLRLLAMSCLPVKSGEDLGMLLQLQPRAADVRDEPPLGVIGVPPADAVEQQPVLHVDDAQAAPAVRAGPGRTPGELAPVVLGRVPHAVDDLPRLTGRRP